MGFGRAYKMLHHMFSRHVNEYKRKTDSQVQMFEIIQDIDNCPVSALQIF